MLVHLRLLGKAVEVLLYIIQLVTDPDHCADAV